MLNAFLFTKIKEEDIGNISFQQDSDTCHTAEATFNVLRPVFEDRIISRRADVIWPPRSYDLTPLDYYLWDNIRESIDEIQLQTIDNVLKNWTDRVGYCMASRDSHLNEITFHY